MNTVDNNSIKNNALLIAKYHMDTNAANKTKAKDCISQLTSQERKSLLEIIKNAQNPSVQITHQATVSLENKLGKINSNAPIVKEKDAHLNKAEKTAMGVWRSIKNFTRVRKSSDTVLKELDQFALFKIQKTVEDSKRSMHMKVFNKDNDVKTEDLIILKEQLKKTSNYSKEVFQLTDNYKALGLEPGASFDQVEESYKELLKKTSRDENIDIAFQNLYVIDVIKRVIPGPVTLENAFNQLNKFKDNVDIPLLRLAIDTLCYTYEKMPENASEL